MSGDNTRARIVEAAGPVFAEKGFQAATVRDICEAAGVNLASVNYHFGDKEQLYIETVKRAHQMRVDQAPMPEHPQGTPAETRLRAFITTLITRMVGVEESPWQSRLMLNEVLNPSSACRHLVHDYFRPQFCQLLDILGGLLPPQTPTYRRQQIAFSIVGQCLYYRVAGEVVEMLVGEDETKAHYRLEALADHIVEFSCCALSGYAESVER